MEHCHSGFAGEVSNGFDEAGVSVVGDVFPGFDGFFEFSHELVEGGVNELYCVQDWEDT